MSSSKECGFTGFMESTGAESCQRGIDLKTGEFQALSEPGSRLKIEANKLRYGMMKSELVRGG